VLADAMRAVGYKPNTIFTWIKRSRAGDQQLMVRWPDSEGEPIQFADAVVIAQRMQHANLEARLRRDVDVGTPRTLRTQSGDVVYEIDHKAVADWAGDAQAARDIGGLPDPFYVHDTGGARVPVIVHDAAPAALRQHVARSLLPGYNPSDRKEIDSKLTGRVLIANATRQGNAQRPAYARPSEGEMSPLRRQLLEQLDDLKRNGPRNAKPRASVTVHGRGNGDDPPERTGESAA
jgi:hypothetical protein